MTDNLVLKKSPSLKDFQEYMKLAIKLRGFEKETIYEIFILFLEECGELAKAVRKSSGIKTDSTIHKLSAADEAADVFIYLVEICNLLDIDLEQAFRDKEEKNKLRTWK
jgi:NTP pyrophosphatase (non-canonical NTP hydrolase)